MNEEIPGLLSEFENKLKDVSSLTSLEELKNEYLGRKGIVNGLLVKIQTQDVTVRKTSGSEINVFKKNIEEKIADHKTNLLRVSESPFVDVSIPKIKLPQGSLHIVTHAIEEISRLFERLGFIRMSYREVEWEYFSFEALNMPKNHPARDDFETFFVDVSADDKWGRMVMTPHTSNGQIREMERVKSTPPIKMINIGKTYRPNWDASHVPMFHQFEGLCIDKGISIVNLKGTIDYFVKSFFGFDRVFRLRPFHFQFTEPSFEIDISCDVCSGTGIVNGLKCKLCKSGWLELGGAGMVHPNVLKSGNIDSNMYSGWAFGFGIERVAMMKEGLKLDDIRVLYSGDIRFLQQF